MSGRKLERETTHEAITWLRSKDWICRRQHSGLFMTQYGTPIRMGENGECDWRCMRAKVAEYVEYFELEMKRPGEKPEDEQLEYMAKRTYQGFNATWADSIEMLQRWYKDRYL